MTVLDGQERRLYRWLRTHVQIVDVVLAAALGIVAVLPYMVVGVWQSFSERSLEAFWLSIVGMALVVPLAWRRTAPIAAAAAMLVPCVAQLAFGIDIVLAQVAVLVMVASLAAHAQRWAARAGFVTAMCGVLLLVIDGWIDPARVFSARDSLPLAIVQLALGWSLVVASWLAGDVTRSRLAEGRALADRAARLERDRERERALAAAEERARIARELHDVVAHSLAIVVTQADGARYSAGAAPGGADPATDAALAAIAETARGSLAEMRRLLGVLHAEQEDAPTGPSPGVADIGDLVASVRASGTPVELVERGAAPADLGTGAGLVLYRVVQEALTNVLKHTRPGTAADVVLEWRPGLAEVTITDSGGGMRGDSDGAGRGLTGMRERLALYGGGVTIGAGEHGGVVVRAVLPTDETVAR